MATLAERRIELQMRLEELLGSKNVYFQPPSNLQLQYPCIVYSRSRTYDRYADNLPYLTAIQYTVTLITKNPDDPLWGKLKDFPRSSFNRHFVTDGLYHDTFEIYF